MAQKDNHSLYNDSDGKTNAVFEFLRAIDTSRSKAAARVVIQARTLAMKGKLDEALYLVGYTNDRTRLDLDFDDEGNRVRARGTA